MCTGKESSRRARGARIQRESAEVGDGSEGGRRNGLLLTLCGAKTHHFRMRKPVAV